MKRRAPSLRRIFLEAAVLVVAHFILLQGLARVNLLEHLLAPGADSRLALGVTAAFLLLRVFLLVLAPGWLLVRLWFWTTRADGRGPGEVS
jgi:hypothetical protein